MNRTTLTRKELFWMIALHGGAKPLEELKMELGSNKLPKLISMDYARHIGNSMYALTSLGHRRLKGEMLWKRV